MSKSCSVIISLSNNTILFPLSDTEWYYPLNDCWSSVETIYCASHLNKSKSLLAYPLIMAKDSSLEKYELPGRTVTVSLPKEMPSYMQGNSNIIDH